MTIKDDDEKLYHFHKLGKCNLTNPNSAEVCLILYLYSMEPFHTELQKASRAMDTTKIEMLGPFAMALYLVLMGCNFTE